MMICTRSISVFLALFLAYSFVLIPSKINTTELGDALLYDFLSRSALLFNSPIQATGRKKNFDTKTQIHINKHVYALNARAGEKMWIFFPIQECGCACTTTRGKNRAGAFLAFSFQCLCVFVEKMLQLLCIYRYIGF